MELQLFILMVERFMALPQNPNVTLVIILLVLRFGLVQETVAQKLVIGMVILRPAFKVSQKMKNYVHDVEFYHYSLGGEGEGANTAPLG
jgi:hypothetical protein